MKRPASQYYWGDWRRDTALQACSLTARGLWHEMNCLMHDCEPYGHLTVGGVAMESKQLARLVGVTPKECAALLAELEDAGVFSRTADGVIFSRRMVRDEEVRNRRAAGGQEGAEHGIKGGIHGVKGGRPSKDKGGINNPPYNPPSGSEDGGLKTPLTDENPPPPASASAFAVNPESQPSTVNSKGVADVAQNDPPAANAASPPSKRGSRLDAGWVLPKSWGDWALAEFPTWTAETVRQEASKFADYWHAKAGKDASKLDWLATWRGWCRKAIAFAPTANSKQPEARRLPDFTGLPPAAAIDVKHSRKRLAEAARALRMPV
jgi:hypothetical protein